MRFLLVLAIASGFLAAADPKWIADAGGVLIRDKAGNVTGVDLRSSWVTDSDLPELARMPQLKRLDLSLSRVSDHGLRSLRAAPGIAELNLYYAEQITDEGMSAIKGWKHLRRLNVRGTKVTDMTLEFIATTPTLESLDIGFAQITDVGLEHLAALPNLKELTIGGNKLTDHSLQLVRQLSQLQYLDIGGSQRTDSGLWFVSLTEAGVDSIATLTELKELRLSGTAVSARSLEKLKSLDKLERLRLQSCRRIGDDAVAALSAFPRLRILDVKGSVMTEQGVEQLHKALPDCRILN